VGCSERPLTTTAQTLSLPSDTKGGHDAHLS
jgi:hypothetical protein